MICKHNWHPLDLQSSNPNRYRYQCTRCGNIISALLKEKP
jgi:hypothetical protein